ncbi:MAG: hypothetical protein ABWZ66_09630 [Pyrinomonadaceae bacterium]
MRELKWNEYDFVECLGVLSEFDEDSLIYFFKFEKDGLILEIGVCAYQSFVEISLSQKSGDEHFLTTSFFVRDKIQYINEKNVSFLEFNDCVISDLYDIDFSNKEKYSDYVRFEIHTFPKFQIKFL